ncbi:hypothetical protein ABZP36_020013 [Zizania latifolia]
MLLRVAHGGLRRAAGLGAVRHRCSCKQRETQESSLAVLSRANPDAVTALGRLFPVPTPLARPPTGPTPTRLPPPHHWLAALAASSPRHRRPACSVVPQLALRPARHPGAALASALP